MYTYEDYPHGKPMSNFKEILKERKSPENMKAIIRKP